MKIKTAALFIFFLVSMLPFLIFSASAEVEGIFEYYDESDYGYVMIAKCREPVGKVVIPSEIGGNPVVTIHDSAFKDATELTAVVIPESVSGIYATSFEGCKNLKDVYYGGSASQWNEMFIGFESEMDEKITDIPLLDATIHFGKDNVRLKKLGVFEYIIEDSQAIIMKCDRSAKGKITVPEKIEGFKVKAVGNHAFFTCGQIEEIVLPDTVEKISTSAFAYCEKLKKVNIPDKVKEIKAFAFVNCFSLENIVLPEGLSEITMGLFMRSGIKNIELPSMVKTMSYRAFYNCEKLESIKLSEKLETVEEGVFTKTAIKELVFYEGVRKIEAWAITFCKNLEVITFPKSIEKIGMNVCEGCDNLKTVRYAGTESDWENIDYKKINSAIENAEKVFSYKAPEEKMQWKKPMYIAVSSTVVLVIIRLIISAIKKRKSL